ncbi:tRNA-uridine aminocarboxypropyltransferase [Actimicrobium antarcticum]|uniref:tRNA-uridine aminocarboxypropyltransferase n=1 Tax=Actimicrobium antarcticum TaxID=1051899 RepID=A0ABP7SX85_9BURK
MESGVTSVPAVRARCARCLRAQSACICQWITPVATATEVVILQHPLEVANAKGSARLLHLSLAGSMLVTGERFAEPDLRALLDGQDSGRTTLLLYPDQPGQPLRPLSLPHPQLHRLRVIVLDGTWRKSRKMLFRNPLLQQLPRLALQDLPTSQYRIRKAHRADQLSTLEATCHALLQVGESAAPLHRLLRAFDGFVGQQAGYQIAGIERASSAGQE